MPQIDDAIEVEIRELSRLGVEICSMAGSSRSEMNDVQIRKISNWVTRVGQMLGTLLPPTSQYRVSYDTALKENDFWNLHGNHFAHLSAIGGIIAAVEHELDKGLLDNRSRLVQADIEQPLPRRNLINLAHFLPKQPKDFNLYLVETFNEVVNLTLHDQANSVNPFEQLEHPTQGGPLSRLMDLIGKALLLTR